MDFTPGNVALGWTALKLICDLLIIIFWGICK